MHLKKLLALLLALTLLPCFPVLAEETDETDDAAQNETEEVLDPDDTASDGADLTEEEMAEIAALDEVDEDEEESAATAQSGDVYMEDTLDMYDVNSTAIYTAHISDNSTLYATKDKEGPRVAQYTNGFTADILYVGLVWVIARNNKDGKIGWIKRERISSVTAVDSVNTCPYGVMKSIYLATTATSAHIRKSMNDNADCYLVLNEGTQLSIWEIRNGWAIIIYKRNYGYINMNELTDLIPVSPTDEPISDDSPIAAYTSYYTVNDTEIVQNRITNIGVACERLTRVMQPGESLNFNKQVGPFRKSNGYKSAIVLVDGKSVVGSGGGTCQVSSTLYNALLQLPGIEILQRRPHGPSGASYLPHGVDAAVGSDNLNLRFRNDYDFPIRVEGHSSRDGALLMVIYRAD